MSVRAAPESTASIVLLRGGLNLAAAIAAAETSSPPLALMLCPAAKAPAAARLASRIRVLGLELGRRPCFSSFQT